MERKIIALRRFYIRHRRFSKMMERTRQLTLELHQYHNPHHRGYRGRQGAVPSSRRSETPSSSDFKEHGDALQSAIEIQYQLYEYNKEHRDLPLLVRVGVHPRRHLLLRERCLGEGDQHRRRACSPSPTPGCICMSGDVYNHVLSKVDFKADKLGRVSLKNISKESTRTRSRRRTSNSTRTAAARDHSGPRVRRSRRRSDEVQSVPPAPPPAPASAAAAPLVVRFLRARCRSRRRHQTPHHAGHQGGAGETAQRRSDARPLRRRGVDSRVGDRGLGFKRLAPPRF